MEGPTLVAMLQKPTVPRFANNDDVDRYYQAYDRNNPRLVVMPFFSMVTVFWLVFFAPHGS